jgi:hypothetical protein
MNKCRPKRVRHKTHTGRQMYPSDVEHQATCCKLYQDVTDADNSRNLHEDIARRVIFCRNN